MSNTNMVIRDGDEPDVAIYGLRLDRSTGGRQVITYRRSEPDELSVITHDAATVESLQETRESLVEDERGHVMIRNACLLSERGRMVLKLTPVKLYREKEPVQQGGWFHL